MYYHQKTIENSFIAAIYSDAEKLIAENDIKWSGSKLTANSVKIPVLGSSTAAGTEKVSIATSLHTDLDALINYFARPDSLFKKYPALGVQPVIALSLMVAALTPIVHNITPNIADSPDIACKMYDVVNDYRSRAVYARLEHVDAVTDELIHDELINELEQPYNQYGYNRSGPPTINCTMDHFPGASSILDDYNEKRYFFEWGSGSGCGNDYRMLVRHRVEQMFPTDLLKSLCKRPSQLKPSGTYAIHCFVVFV